MASRQPAIPPRTFSASFVFQSCIRRPCLFESSCAGHELKSPRAVGRPWAGSLRGHANLFQAWLCLLLWFWVVEIKIRVGTTAVISFVDTASRRGAAQAPNFGCRFAALAASKTGTTTSNKAALSATKSSLRSSKNCEMCGRLEHASLGSRLFAETGQDAGGYATVRTVSSC
jgi:hypothetical protein